ncbi:ATP-binding cassette domain-containing protein [Synechococcales cyanobacterium C]|uniref:ATP-binding cassette domain-containing protein n=1 Tax=Petrachloros mirabilis ULC683 TaxID=2781853 RepID=A0A8K2A8W5_9CYAN|nr:ABC transporter ATP-binding protein [Petrachloros mirabilis]NCJ08496.1 ATP-binding cassette domain-containing protein [Petrachloros mirabilis ULC683]
MTNTLSSRRFARQRLLLAYLRPHWRAVLLGVLALFVVNAVGTYLPLLIRQIIDDLQVTFVFDQVLRSVLLIGLLASLMWAVRLGSRVAIFGVGRQVEFDLKQRIFGQLLRLEPAYFTTNTAGDLISRSTSDVDNIRRLVGFALLSFVNTIFAYALTLPVMLGLDVGLTLAAIAVYPLIMLLVQAFSNRLRNEQLQVQQALSDLSELVQEDMSGIALIKIYAQEENERRAFHHRNQALLAANLVLAKTRNILFPVLGGMASISLLVLLWFGSRAIASGAITVGDFVALLLYVERLIFPTALLGFTITAYQRGEVSLDRIESILQVQPRIASDPEAVSLERTAIRGKLVAKNLTVTYPGTTAPALDRVSFQIHPGETVAIVGPVGSGKSTLANALPRLLEIQPGQVFLDEYDITQIQLRDLRAAIAYVPQDSFLFSTTLKNNIRYGDPLREQLEVEQAAKQAQIHAEVLNFPQIYETLVGERGITLSGGQRQRTALARALLVEAPILILDDALSSVDNQTATAILQALASGSDRKTVIFISHQLSAAAIADQILVMDRGKIVQSGAHDALIHQPGLYQTLWNHQKLEAVLQ